MNNFGKMYGSYHDLGSYFYSDLVSEQGVFEGELFGKSK